MTMDKENGTENEPAADKAERPASEATSVDFDQPDTLVGQRLDGRFLIEKNLTDGGADEGGIGVVYLANDTKLMGKEVVVKILQETALKHEDIVRKFLHEKEALIRLDHPGIVRILDSGTLTDGNPFMVMEFIEGHSLRKTLKAAGSMPLDAAAHVIESVTDALAAAHSKNILHRDIKPENIMLTPQEEGFDRVRLIDFGIARVGESQLAPATEIERAIGTILYIPPEQLIGKLDLTPSGDVYAAAIVAYEMLTGELPFKPTSIAEMYKLESEGVKTPPSQLRPDIPAEAEKILLSALEFEPEKRPQNIRTFGRDLARTLRDVGVATKDDFSGMVTEVITKAVPTDFTTVKHIKPDEPELKRRGPIKWVAAMILVAVAIPAGYLVWNAIKARVPDDQIKPVVTSADSAAERELSYFLMVQKMRGGKPFEAPFKSSGQEVFESGYKFNINFQSQRDGYMYVFNEGKDAQGNTGYYLLFPTPSINGGSSQVAAGQQIETAQNTFSGGKGTEVMWLIFTKTKREDLESIMRSAAASDGTLKDATNIGSLQKFLEEFKDSKPESSKDTANQRTLLKANGDTAVHRFELEHR